MKGDDMGESMLNIAAFSERTDPAVLIDPAPLVLMLMAGESSRTNPFCNVKS